MLTVLESRRPEGKAFTGPRDATIKKVLREAGADQRVVTYRAINDAKLASVNVWLARSKVVLLCGVEAVQFFRPDYSSKQRGRPFVLHELFDMMGRTVIGIPTHHPYFATKKMDALDEMVDDCKQAVYRCKKDLFERWPEDCHTCNGPLEKYDVGGVGWCAYHFTGYEVPRRLDQLALAI